MQFITRLKFPVTGTHPRKLPQKVLRRASALTGLLGGSDLKADIVQVPSAVSVDAAIMCA
jgi:hypothetical protein